MVELVDMLGLGSSSVWSKGSSPFFGIFQKNMLTLLLGYTFSVIFEDSVIKLLKNNFYFRALTFSGASVCWFYQEHVRRDYDMTGAKKLTSEHTFRYKVFIQVLLVCRYFCSYTHIVSVLEFGTLSLLFSFYSVVLINHYLPQFKIVERITTNNYSKFFVLGLRSIKREFIKMRRLTLNEKFLLSLLLLVFRCGVLKTYFWLDFLIFFRPFFLLVSLFTIVFSIFLPYYLIYSFLIPNYPKNIALLIKVLTKKSIFYLLLSLVSIILMVFDIDIQSILNENFFKETFFKILFFLVQIS